MRAIHLGFVLSLVVLLGAAQPAWSADELRKELAGLAEAIEKYLTGKQLGDRIALGAFTASTRIPASAGPAIQKALSEELQQRKLRVSQDANLEAKGDYFSVEDAETKRLTVRLKVRLVDRGTGEELVVFNQSLLGDGLLGSLLGLNVALPPDDGGKDRAARLRDSVKEPRVVLVENRVFPTAGSPYGIEVLVKGTDGYAPLVPEKKDGLAYVALKRNDIYAIRLINETAFDAAVTLTIDGLNMFAFSENRGYRDLGKVVVPPGKSIIQGWHLNNEKTSRFLVTEYAKSAAAELRSEVGLGTITATFAAAWPVDAAPPAGEPLGRGATDATGRGPTAAVRYQAVERYYGVVRATVSVRYTK